MREYLTIGELSKLMNTSTYNLRYYEKEGLISPKHTSENGYRLYTYEDVYMLNEVLLLREANMPIKEIKALMQNYSNDSYKEAMNKSLSKINEEIEKLTAIKSLLVSNINSVDNYTSGPDEVFAIKELEKRRFVSIKKSGFEMDYSIKETYDAYLKCKIDMNDVYNSDIIYIFGDEEVTFSLQDDEGRYDLDEFIYEKGKYLSYNFHAEDEREIEDKIIKLFEHIMENSLEYEGEIAFIMSPQSYMASSNGYYGELQIKIK